MSKANKPQLKIIDEEVIDTFLYGQCGALALAVAERTGCNIVIAHHKMIRTGALYPQHAFCSFPGSSDDLCDISGVLSQDKVYDLYHSSFDDHERHKYDVVFEGPFSAEEFKKKLPSIGWDELDMKKSRSFVDSVLELWKREGLNMSLREVSPNQMEIPQISNKDISLDR